MAGFISEWWPESNRNGGRHQIGIPGRIASEFAARRGHRFCRYADDCNIYVRSHRAGERVMASVSQFLTNKLRLKVNEAKSAVARPEARKFLGFSISNDGSERRIAPKALAKFKRRSGT